MNDKKIVQNISIIGGIPLYPFLYAIGLLFISIAVWCTFGFAVCMFVLGTFIMAPAICVLADISLISFVKPTLFLIIGLILYPFVRFYLCNYINTCI